MKKQSPYKFSVIIPCYKLGKHVENAVKSIESQTLKDVEIILVDDASPDKETREILESLSERAKVIYRKDNGGASAARNTGVKAAKAPYILCLDADDTISPDYLQEAYEVLEARPEVGVVASHVQMTGERSGSWKPKPESATFPQALISSPIANASCYRKQAWKDVGGYDESMRGYEDWEFWISIIENDWVFEVLEKPHYIYFNRPGSKVKTSNKNAHAIVNYIVTKHHDTFAKHMNYVIAGTHKKYVDERTKARQLEYLEKRKLSNPLVKLAKVPQKARTALRIILVERDPGKLGQAVKKILGR